MSVTDKELENALQNVKKILLDNVMSEAARYSDGDPAYCLFLLYDDGSSEDLTPVIQIGTKSLLDACEAGVIDGIGDKSNPSKLWYPQQSISFPFPGFPCPGDPLEMVSDLTAFCYQKELFSKPLPGSDPIRYAAMMAEVAMELNQQNWSNFMPVTEHFFVTACDYMGQFMNRDFRASIPHDRWKGLKERYSDFPNIEDV